MMWDEEEEEGDGDGWAWWEEVAGLSPALYSYQDLSSRSQAQRLQLSYQHFT